MKEAFEILILLGVLALLAMLLIPRPVRQPPEGAVASPAAAVNDVSASDPEVRPALKPEQIAATFGWRPPPPPPPPRKVVEMPPEPEPEPPPPAPKKADWLIFTGLVVDGTNRTVYVFKDKRTGRPISLVMNEEHGGWILRQVGSDGFVAEQNGELFEIPR